MWQKRIICSHLEPFRETDNQDHALTTLLLLKKILFSANFLGLLSYCVNWQDNFLKKHIVIEG